MDKKWKNQSERIQQELKALADQVAEIDKVGLTSLDGLTLGFYAKNPNVRERRIEATKASHPDYVEEDYYGPISAMIVGLSDRVSTETQAGEWKFTVIAAKNSKIFGLVIDDETVLFVITKAETPVDSFLQILKDAGERLLEL